MTEKQFITKVKGSFEDNKVILLALDFAKEKYSGLKRLNGEAYITHPIAVASHLIDLGLDQETIATSLICFSVKLCSVTFKQIKEVFGENIETMTKSYSKISSLSYTTQNQKQDELELNRQMFLALGKDFRVILIRICDRYHDVQTLSELPVERQKQIASETMDIFVPLVERLGMGRMRADMEDLCFKYLNPQEYFKLEEALNKKYNQRTEIMNGITAELKDVLEKLKIKGEVTFRFKHIYSIYKKLNQGGMEKIYDVIAHRVIVNNVQECYAVLGEIHSRYKPVAGRIKDYIASPKPNGYQSLHTTLLTKDGVPFEVQIRTAEMHQFCEFGVAAHWRYKGHTSKIDQFEEKMNWFKKTIESESQIKDNEKFLEALKMDLTTGSIWVFTPKYKPIELPDKATPIDFAYAIHSGVGDKCIGAKVNDKIVPLNTELSTGDVVEIITSQSSKGPSLDWLNFVRGNSTRNHIRAYFKKQSKEENIKMGQSILDLEAKKCGYQLGELLADLDLSDLTKRFNLLTLDDVFASIGYGGITAKQALGKVVAERKMKEKLERKTLIAQSQAQKPTDSKNLVIVDGLEGLSIWFGGCCHPIAGDDIVGFTSSRGITIHRADCPNIKNISQNKQLPVSWKDGKTHLFNSTITLTAIDTTLAINKITNLLASFKISVLSIKSKIINNNQNLITLTIQVKDRTQVKTVIAKLKAIDGIFDVK